VLDPAGGYQYVSPSATRVLGRPAAEFAGRSAADDCHPEDAAALCAALAEAAAEPAAVREVAARLRHAGGHWCWVEGTVSNLLADPLVRGLVLTFRDVGERRRLEEALREAQKLEAVGRLAGGLAHDFNNLLTVILGYSGLAVKDLDRDSPCQESVQRIQEAGERAATLIGQLLAFSRKQLLFPQKVDLSRLLGQSRSALERVMGPAVEVVVEADPAASPAFVDPQQVWQLVLHLAANAREAMPGGGRLTLATASGGPGAVVLTVRDTGRGMDARALAHLFEPFYSTKDLGQGSGLGLASVYGTVKQSGGEVAVDSTPGRGTAFRITLPTAAPPKPDQRRLPPLR
jgi:PAS domain S-box-containing protein